MSARIVLHLPFVPARVFDLEETRQYVIGRDPACEIVCTDERVSRQHARLSHEGGRWMLSDLGSKNGTAVDGVAASIAPLASHAWISLGGLLAEFELVSEDRRQADAQARLLRWRTSAELQAGLRPAQGLAPLLRRVLDSILALSNMARGFVMLARPERDFVVAVATGVAMEELASGAFSGSVGAVRRTVEAGVPVVISDVQSDAALAGRASVAAGGIRAILCLPLLVADHLIGVVYADSQRVGVTFDQLDVEILETYAAHAALAIALARVEHEVADLVRTIADRPDLVSEEARALLTELWERSVGGAAQAAPADGGARLAAPGPTLSELVRARDKLEEGEA